MRILFFCWISCFRLKCGQVCTSLSWPHQSWNPRWTSSALSSLNPTSPSPSLYQLVRRPDPAKLTDWISSSVVLDSSGGRSSQPLMDGSDFLEAISKKVDTLSSHAKWWSLIIMWNFKRFLEQFQSWAGQHFMDSILCGQELARRESSRWAPTQWKWEAHMFCI